MDMIDQSTLRLTNNYILVLPDPYFDTYQFGGKETGILTSSYTIDDKGNKDTTKDQHIAVSGTIYAVPETLWYYGREVQSLLERNNFFTMHGTKVRNREDQSAIDDYRRRSVEFDVDVECKIGDKVYWEYLAHKIADNTGLWFDTIHGKMMLVKYDMLILAVRDEDIYPLNGYLIIENEELEKKEVEPGVQGIVRDSGIVLVNQKTEKKTRVTCEAKVIRKGGRCRHYLNHKHVGDAGFFSTPDIAWSGHDVEVGESILYDPRMAKEVEFGLHRTLSSHRLLRIQRKDIYFVLKNELNAVYI